MLAVGAAVIHKGKSQMVSCDPRSVALTPEQFSGVLCGAEGSEVPPSREDGWEDCYRNES